MRDGRLGQMETKGMPFFLFVADSSKVSFAQQEVEFIYMMPRSSRAEREPTSTPSAPNFNSF